MKSTLLKAIALIACFTLFTSAAFALKNDKIINAPKKKADILFVLLSQQGHLKKHNGKPNTYVLTLKNVNPDVVYFTDRPARYTSHIKLSKFLQEWKTGAFKTDPPNAVMEAIRLQVGGKKESKKSVSYEIMLTNPNYNSKSNLLTFEVKPLKGNSTKITKTADSDYVALFIDNCPYCIGN